MSKATFELTTEDVRNACDVMLPVHQADPKDGRVSIEVDPFLAHDTEGTVKSARDLWAAVDRPNVLIKIPATDAGLPAIRQATADGISVNVTLIFGIDRYRKVMDAYLAGLEDAKEAGKDLSTIHSVASFFVSRVDTEVDKRLDKIGTDEADAVRGEAAVANARLAYAAFEEVFGSDRFTALARRRGQRPAAAVGLHRREGRALPRHQVRHRPRRRRHRQHHAGEDPRGVRRPRRGRGRPGHRSGDRPRGRRRAGLRPARARSASTSPTCSRCSSARAWRSSRSPGRSSSTPSRDSSRRPTGDSAKDQA